MQRPLFRRGPRSRGQSLVEFALILPFMLIMLAFALDLGRVFLGWVNLNNSVRVAANYAAQNPNGWNVPGPSAVKTEYQRLVTADADVINCDMPSPVPDPTFVAGPGGPDNRPPRKKAGPRRVPPITPPPTYHPGEGGAASPPPAVPPPPGGGAGVAV